MHWSQLKCSFNRQQNARIDASYTLFFRRKDFTEGQQLHVRCELMLLKSDYCFGKIYRRCVAGDNIMRYFCNVKWMLYVVMWNLRSCVLWLVKWSSKLKPCEPWVYVRISCIWSSSSSSFHLWKLSCRNFSVNLFTTELIS